MACPPSSGGLTGNQGWMTLMYFNEALMCFQFSCRQDFQVWAWQGKTWCVWPLSCSRALPSRRCCRVRMCQQTCCSCTLASHERGVCCLWSKRTFGPMAYEIWSVVPTRNPQEQTRKRERDTSQQAAGNAFFVKTEGRRSWSSTSSSSWAS